MVEADAVRGVSRDLTRRLVVRAMAGSASWFEALTEDAAALRAQVCAPGGTRTRRADPVTAPSRRGWELRGPEG